MATNFSQDSFSVLFTINQASFCQDNDLICIFYVQSQENVYNDKIALRKWPMGEDIVRKNVNEATIDEYGQRVIVFSKQELPPELTGLCQFLYYHFDQFGGNVIKPIESGTFHFTKINFSNESKREENQQQSSAENSSVTQKFTTSVKNLWSSGNKCPVDEKDKKIKELENKLIEKESELDSILKRFTLAEKMSQEKIDKVIRENNSMKEQLDSITVEIHIKDNKLHETHNSLMEMQASNAKLQEECKFLEDQLNNLSNKKEDAERKCEELETEIDKLNTELAIFRSQLDQPIPSFSSKQGDHATIEILRDRLKEAEDKRDEYKVECGTLKKSFSEIERKAIKLEVELDHLKKENVELKDKFEKCEENKFELKVELRIKEKQLKDLTDNSQLHGQTSKKKSK